MRGFLMPLQQHKFMVIPVGREDFANLFAENVISAEIDLVKKVLRVLVRQTVSEEQLAAVTYTLGQNWIPEVWIDSGRGFDVGKMIRFKGPRVDGIRHKMRFDYASSDIVVHEIEWDFTAMIMSNTADSYEPVKQEPKPKERPPAFVSPAEAVAELDKTKP